jgi:hypothetical protein
VSGVRVALRQLPLPARAAVIGAVVLGIVGGAAGLVVGLIAYPPTAWFAVIEVGVPAAAFGAIVGLAVGLIVAAATRRSPRPPHQDQ